ncbi:hypothetical protein Daesc_010473 [Daldinia eschscholtzii]|uniref:Uncharacterized protein n=1 Tax=Daldinia eschscholtzii TaxID=292717 RepID=A0AAX6M8A4_9PEZI
MPKAKTKPQPPSQFHILPPGQPHLPPKDNKKKPKNGSSKDLFETNVPPQAEVLVPQTPDNKKKNIIGSSSSNSTKQARNRPAKSQDRENTPPPAPAPVDEAERYPYGFSPAATEGKYIYEYKSEEELDSYDDM